MNDCMRREAMSRFKGRCGYCGSPGARTIDHIIPINRGGWDWPDNLMASCHHCNNFKGDMTLEQFRFALYQGRFGRYPYKRGIDSKIGKIWQKTVAKFTGDKVIFHFEHEKR